MVTPAEAPVYVEVAVDVRSQGLWGTFTYSVPAAQRERAVEGSIAIVPFGPRRVRGFILGPAAPDQACESHRIRDIVRVIDPCPALSPEALELARRVSDEYCSPMQIVLRAMIPPGLGAPGKRLVRLVLDQEQIESLSGSLTVEEAGIVGVLAEEGERTPAELAEATGILRIDAVLRGLEARGIVSRETVFKKPAGPRMVLEVSLTREVSEEELERMSVSAPRRAALLKWLIAEGRPVAAAEAVRRSGAGQSSLKGLEKAGLVRLERVAVREPVSRTLGGSNRPVRLTTAALEPALAEASCDVLRPGAAAVLLLGSPAARRAVYAAIVSRTLQAGRGAIILVPEINMARRMSLEAGGIRGEAAVFHSGLPEGERFSLWKDISEGRARFVVGTRSVVFAPIQNLGLIVVDEEQDEGFKQADGNPRYNARDVAAMRSGTEGCRLVLGSEFPSVESYYLASEGQYRIIRAPDVPGGRRPECVAVDMRDELKAGNRSVFSRRLQAEVRRALEAKEQAVLFLNRRGFSSFILCRECGLTVRCPDCDVALTYHKAGLLKCHYCGREEPAPDVCPRCGGRHVKPFGAGTQRVEEEARRLFPSARVVRVDFDTASRRTSYEALMRSFIERKADILVGSQMVAGDYDLPPVAVVGVMSADLTLNLPDFRSAERTFHLLTKMSSAAAGHTEGVAVIQTYDGGHYSITAACRNEYETFYRNEIEARRDLGYPPFGHLVNVILWSRSDVTAQALARDAARRLGAWPGGGFEIMGPVAAPFARLRGWFRWQVLMKGSSRKDMAAAAKDLTQAFERKMRATGSRLTVDVDPVSML